MRTITVFPKHFERMNKQIAKVTFIHALSRDDHDADTLELMAEQGFEEDYRSCEFWIVLKDGRAFGYWASTPEYLRDYMERENRLSVVSLGLLVISQMTEKASFDALEDCLEEATYHEVEPLVYRMSTTQYDDDDDNRDAS